MHFSCDASFHFNTISKCLFGWACCFWFVAAITWSSTVIIFMHILQWCRLILHKIIDFLAFFVSLCWYCRVNALFALFLLRLCDLASGPQVNLNWWLPAHASLHSSRWQCSDHTQTGHQCVEGSLCSCLRISSNPWATWPWLNDRLVRLSLFY